MNEPGPDPDRTGAVAFQVVALGRRRRRLDPGLLLLGLAAVLVVAAVARPWASQPAPTAVIVDPAPAGGSPSAPASPAALPSAPARAVPDLTNLATEIHLLAAYSGTWGVGAGGLPQTPSASSDATGWSAWVAVRPVSTQGSTTDVTELPAGVTSRDLCSDLPQLPSGAQVIAITAPSGPIGALGIRGWRLRGFRDDPPNIEVLSGLRQITPFQSGDISYLQRNDGQAWTDGRYEFWLAGSAGTTLTVCLGQV